MLKYAVNYWFVIDRISFDSVMPF